MLWPYQCRFPRKTTMQHGGVTWALSSVQTQGVNSTVEYGGHLVTSLLRRRNSGTLRHFDITKPTRAGLYRFIAIHYITIYLAAKSCIDRNVFANIETPSIWKYNFLNEIVRIKQNYAYKDVSLYTGKRSVISRKSGLAGVSERRDVRIGGGVRTPM